MSSATPTVRPDFGAYVMAVDRVEKLLRRAVGALEASGIEYAVIGGNAVAAWVSTVDRTHVADMISVGLVTAALEMQIPGDLLPRLEAIRKEMENG